METFEIKSFDSKEIILAKSADVEKFYTTLQSEDVIKLVWHEGNVKKSQVFIASKIAGNIKSGDTVIKSEEMM